MWEFLCQNSCATGINRKSTAVIFTLENEQHEIVGKSVMPFKVCSCPKRDMQREDAMRRSLKREHMAVPAGKRPSKMMCLAEVKVEPPPPPSPSKNYELPLMDLSHTVTLTMPSKESMAHVLRCGLNEAYGAMGNHKDTRPEYYMMFADRIRGLLHSL